MPIIDRWWEGKSTGDWPTMDLYGHLIDHNLWASAKRVGGILGASGREAEGPDSAGVGEAGA